MKNLLLVIPSFIFFSSFANAHSVKLDISEVEMAEYATQWCTVDGDDIKDQRPATCIKTTIDTVVLSPEVSFLSLVTASCATFANTNHRAEYKCIQAGIQIARQLATDPNRRSLKK
ncbi:MAG: hypothetical protein ACXVCY_05790 [Pseudobdellovibrionaceae bacterium]